MNVLQVHNYYRHAGGEDFAVDALCSLLKGHGVKVSLLTRNSADVPNGLIGKFKAFASSVYSSSARSSMQEILREQRPDVVHVHNLYPLLSPAVLDVCHNLGVPIVMTCHNYRLTCPTGLHLTDGNICERCASDGAHLCVLRNCRGSLLESIAYAVRHAAAQARGIISRSVTVFIAPTRFLKQRLVSTGIPASRVLVVPNMTPIPVGLAASGTGDYVAYAGRISQEKGLDTLLGAARELPHVPVRIAGDWSSMPWLRDRVTGNVSFEGFLRKDEMSDFYSAARLFALPSRCFEVFPLVLAEAMAHGLPVVASRIGGLPEIVDDGMTGLLFRAGDVGDMAAKIRALWEDPEMCRRMGAAAQEKAAREYSAEAHFRGVMAAYEEAIQISKDEALPGR